MGTCSRRASAFAWLILLAGAALYLSSCVRRQQPAAASQADNTDRARPENHWALAEHVLMDAFEKGRSLVIVEILSVHSAEEHGVEFWHYKARVVRPIVLGDCTKESIQGPLELHAGASYGEALKPHSTYALFITRDCPHHFSWAHRDNLVKVDLAEKGVLQAIVQGAARAYEKTAIRGFREVQFTERPRLPSLPGSIVAFCEQFRARSENRVEFAKKIHESELGSRRDDSAPYLSYLRYLPPRIGLSREQVLFLLGKPTLKLGWTYFWFCGEDKSISRPGKYAGILSVTFDESENVTLLLYRADRMVKWKGGRAG